MQSPVTVTAFGAEKRRGEVPVARKRRSVPRRCGGPGRFFPMGSKMEGTSEKNRGKFGKTWENIGETCGSMD